jgi:hypothetical protein
VSCPNPASPSTLCLAASSSEISLAVSVGA